MGPGMVGVTPRAEVGAGRRRRPGGVRGHECEHRRDAGDDEDEREADDTPATTTPSLPLPDRSAEPSLLKYPEIHY